MPEAPLPVPNSSSGQFLPDTNETWPWASWAGMTSHQNGLRGILVVRYNGSKEPRRKTHWAWSLGSASWVPRAQNSDPGRLGYTPGSSQH